MRASLVLYVDDVNSLAGIWQKQESKIKRYRSQASARSSERLVMSTENFDGRKRRKEKTDVQPSNERKQSLRASTKAKSLNSESPTARTPQNTKKQSKSEKELLSDTMHHEEAILTEEEIQAERVKERNDTRNIAFLLFLYFLQGIPLGISSAASFILADKKSSYSDIALFSISSWPFSLKLLWAPFVDSVYWKTFGRRKSWLAPLQYMIAMTMLTLSFSIDGWLNSPTISHEHVVLLTGAFLFMYFLAATQDIVVDGWAITLLSRRHVSWASTANVIGQTAGSCVANLSLLSLSSASFCNSWLRSESQQSAQGMLSFSDFLYGWSFVFMVATTLVLLKRERSDDQTGGEHENLGLRQTYWTLLQIGKLPNVLRYVSLLFAAKVSFAAVDSVTFVKLIEAGFPKETLAFFRVLLLPVDLLLPLVVARMRNYTQRPLSTWAHAIFGRMIIGSFFALLLYFTPAFRTVQTRSSSDSGASAAAYEFSFSYTSMLFSLDVLYTSVTTTMFLAVMAFHARVSNPQIGGTYMTLLNTLSNIAGTIPGFFALSLLDYITFSSCKLPSSPAPDTQLTLNISKSDGSFESVLVSPDFACHTARGKQLCTAAGGLCEVHLDGYYIEMVISLIYGVLISWWCSRTAKRLDDSPLSSWMPPLLSGDNKKRLYEHNEAKYA